MTASAGRQAVAAGILLGVGMGGFVDGILFHQILQLHNMLSARVLRDSLIHEQINMFWDGLFHAFTWTMVALGLLLQWRAGFRGRVVLSGRATWGSLLLGWGLFNVVEGVIDHELLGVHHVVENGNHPLWDSVFLLAGAALLLLGWRMVKAGVHQAVDPSSPRTGPR